MTFLIVPDSVSLAINKKLDEALEKVPKAKKDREIFYQELLNHFNETGVIPDFDIAPVPFLESFEQIKE